MADGPAEFGLSVAFGLVLVYGDAFAFVRGLGFDYTHGYTVHEEDVIGGAGIGVVFADGDTQRCRRVQCLLVLNSPTGSEQHRINAFAGALFGGEQWHKGEAI